MEEKIVLIDGNSILYRAFYALPLLKNKEGAYSNAIYGFLNILTKVITEYQPKYLGIAFDAGKITFNEDKLEELGVEYETLATTTEDAFVRTNLNQTSVLTGECTVAAIATKTLEDGNTSKLVIYSNELFAMDMQVQINGYAMYTIDLYNNKDLILNSIGYLNEREDTITIRKNYEDVSYTVTEEQNSIIMLIIFTVPVVIIIAGIVVWQVRRRKR